ncbi:MAG: molybdopterin synthase sulfur carrier subunit [Crocinitomicaceae bacterium]|jgi:molybdopterin synthase sulfur carrier subunit
MTTNVHYYGMISEKLQRSSEEMELDASNGIIDLRSVFEEKHPVLKDLSYQIAVNQELTESIDAGLTINEIALLPPFAGG